VNVFIEVSWASAVPNDHTYLWVIGSRGVARLQTLFGLSPNGDRPEHPLKLWIEGWTEPEGIKGTSDLLQPYRDQWRFFIDSLNQGNSLRSSLQDGLAMVQMLDAMYRSADELESSISHASSLSAQHY
jgi:predicted dehydrogenase